MSTPVAPSYFEPIRARAAARWDQLDHDPELAAPWVQLFNQVQSPRHVVSELLQNADDAGADRVAVRLAAGQLGFEHNGQDFAEDHFASLCRFAYSNKRKLHTIGFRGIGFKSTFSLGPEVRLATPTLAVAYHRRRFTEPYWAGEPTADGHTRVTVRVDDPNRERELDKNLAEWVASPASLLFFRHVRELEVNGVRITRTVLGPGPVANTLRVRLSTLPDRELLVARSPDEPFPAECLAEVRQERGDPGLDLPACQVEIVLGLPAPNRVYVVLPTGVKLDLPFSCNGPFLQDPARMLVKDPATSPTNRWLLDRAGRLAAETLLAWVGDRRLPLADRAAAYALFPDRAQGGHGVEGDVCLAVREAYRAAFGFRPALLTQSGELAAYADCLAPPRELYGVWDDDQLRAVFRRPGAGVLAEAVPDAARAALSAAGLLEAVSPEQTLHLLRRGVRPPRPAGWEQLAALWRFVNTHVRFDAAGAARRVLPIVPAQGEAVLHPAEGVVRLATARLSDEDARFLAGNSRVVDGGWLEYVGRAGDGGDAAGDDLRDTLARLGLGAASPADRVIEVVCGRLFGEGGTPAPAECVRVAHLAAALDAKAPDELLYLTEAGRRANPAGGLMWDAAGRWDELLPAGWAADHRVSRDYAASFTSCTRQQWADWLGSPKSRLTPFPPFDATDAQFWKDHDLTRVLAPRQIDVPADYPYPNGFFRLFDADFPPALVRHWEHLAAAGRPAWGRVLEGVLTAAAGLWQEAVEAKLYRYHNSSTRRPLTTRPIPTAWVYRFRSLRCLPDTYGTDREPTELYLRTPETEPLLGVEPFVKSELDTEATKPLLRLLGVRDTPAGADKLVARVRAWSRMPAAGGHLHEVVRWYEALDRVLARSDTAVVDGIRATFRAEPLVLAHTGDWARSAEVFQAADEDALPDTPTVHPAVRGLTLWTRLGVEDRPTADHVLDWLRGLPAGGRLDGPTAARVRAALRRYPAVAWTRCGCWLTLAGAWTPTAGIKYRVSMQELARWKDLFPAVRAATADLRGLPADALQTPPFDGLEDLTAVIEFRPAGDPPAVGGAEGKPWLAALAAGLRRVRLGEDAQTAAVRRAATRLARTAWLPATELLVQPWIGGEAVGDPSAATALWFRETLYVNGSRARWFDPVADAVARGFPDAGPVRQVVRDCVDRDPVFVAEYVAATFDLNPEEPLPEPASAPESIPVGRVTTRVWVDAPNPPAGDSRPAAEPGGDTGSAGAVSEPRDQGLTPTAGSDTAPVQEVAAGQDACRAEDARPNPGTVRTLPEWTGSSYAGEEYPAGRTPGGSSGATSKPKPYTPAKPATPSKPTGPTLFERFAAALGFGGCEDEKEFRHPDGSRLLKAAKPFGWELSGPDGLVVRSYAVVEECLLTDGAEVPAEVWNFVNLAPERMTVLGPAPDGSPAEWAGADLVRLKAEGRLKVYPRAYLLRVDDA